MNLQSPAKLRRRVFALLLCAGLGLPVLAAKDDKPLKEKPAKDKNVVDARKDEPKVKQSSEERWLETVHEQIKPSEAEWDVLKPRVDKVIRLVREVNAGRESKGVREPRAEKIDDMATTDVHLKSKALNDALFDPFTSPSRVREHVAAYRAARESAKQNLLRAQEELRQLLTTRQEAILIIMGLLD
ncbi:hypothetical protein [Humisphaera borealis]|uniref:Uncharacterized protein n=1 Tax=Humisphaera borealis TaxID=2807512 RepID=A0A7M2WWG7_9BACT|nr:hypothetical protein [Humisphaera borealis]QOV88850.1 hypothetical protein IPV69_21890 [Humisphaera borealis]